MSTGGGWDARSDSEPTTPELRDIEPGPQFDKCAACGEEKNSGRHLPIITGALGSSDVAAEAEFLSGSNDDERRDFYEAKEDEERSAAYASSFRDIDDPATTVRLLVRAQAAVCRLIAELDVQSTNVGRQKAIIERLEDYVAKLEGGSE